MLAFPCEYTRRAINQNHFGWVNLNNFHSMFHRFSIFFTFHVDIVECAGKLRYLWCVQRIPDPVFSDSYRLNFYVEKFLKRFFPTRCLFKIHCANTHHHVMLSLEKGLYGDKSPQDTAIIN
jgi:hypothetical protein